MAFNGIYSANGVKNASTDRKPNSQPESFTHIQVANGSDFNTARGFFNLVFLWSGES
jgi:hypothetical protein